MGLSPNRSFLHAFYINRYGSPSENNALNGNKNHKTADFSSRCISVVQRSDISFISKTEGQHVDNRHEGIRRGAIQQELDKFPPNATTEEIKELIKRELPSRRHFIF
ncbi:hypothetical protein [Erwinia sp. ErVv1]|uniref:hypothetical protein n=1 Tax=Erwinia sp. ErVv1 TaxID=1603299 RepID=UPI000B2BFD0F|nr:hypothetical protein [Erwinia sp. ErVv1]